MSDDPKIRHLKLAPEAAFDAELMKVALEGSAAVRWGKYTAHLDVGFTPDQAMQLLMYDMQMMAEHQHDED